MRLCIDVGSTFLKAAVFEGGQRKKSYRGGVFSHSFFSELCSEMQLTPEDLEDVVFCSVHPQWYSELFFDRKVVRTRISPDQTKLQLKYCPVSSLGEDRLALLMAGEARFGLEENFILIDIGTCITYDFVSKGSHMGGRISPGIDARFRAMTHVSGQLPSVTFEKKEGVCTFEQSTSGCMKSGVFYGVVGEIRDVIDQVLNIHGAVQCVLSGTFAQRMEMDLERSVWVRPHFVLEGLYAMRVGKQKSTSRQYIKNSE